MTEKKAATRRKITPENKATPEKLPAKVAVAAITVKTIKKEKKSGSKEKVVRDSFTMPKSDYAKIAELKQVCLKMGRPVKKSELLRAGLHALGKLSALNLKKAIVQMELIKTGRPKKN